MLSIRDITNKYLGKWGRPLSVNTDVYGYSHRDLQGRLFGTLTPLDILPGAGTSAAPTTRSIRRHLQTIQGVSVDLVGFLLERPTNDLSIDWMKIQFGTQVARDIFAQINLGIRRITWRLIHHTEAQSYLQINNPKADANRLTRAYSGPGGGIDVFFVQTIDGFSGFAPEVPGPASKEESGSGVLVAIANRLGAWIGRNIAHEVGHYLGLPHIDRPQNLMCSDDNGPLGVKCDAVWPSISITDDQAEIMKRHPVLNPRIPDGPNGEPDIPPRLQQH